MGMYTELILGIEFSNDTPEYITEAFDYLINKHDDAEISEEARNFIDEYHVSMMLFGCSYYFAVTNPNYAFYRDGYDLIGWSTDPNAIEPQYTYDDEFVLPENPQGQSITLYAVWGLDDGGDKADYDYMESLLDSLNK